MQKEVSNNFLVKGTNRYIHFLMGGTWDNLDKKTAGCTNKNWHLFVNAKRWLVIHAFTKKDFPLPYTIFVLAL